MHDGEIHHVHHFDSDQKFFLGGAGTSSYPLHRDMNDADAVFTVFEGCKEFVMMKASSRGVLSRLDLPGFNIWNEDLYSSGLPDGGAGWRGTVKQGESLFMPGDVLHEVRNACPSTVAMCRRPWRTTAVRDIKGEMEVSAPDTYALNLSVADLVNVSDVIYITSHHPSFRSSQELYEEIKYEAIVGRSWLWWSIDRLGAVFSCVGKQEQKNNEPWRGNKNKVRETK